MYLILKIFDLYSFLILLNILGSWIDPYNQISIFQWIRKFTDPYLKMFKIVIPIGNMYLDISAITGLIVLDLVKSLLVRAVSIGGF